MTLERLEKIKNLENPILVTGHSGFKGTWLGLLLNALEIPYVGFSLPPEPDSLYCRLDLLGKNPEIFGDIRNYETTRSVMEMFRPSAILHLAAQPLVLNSYINPLETFQTNVMGTVNLLETAFRCDTVKSFIGITTDKVYKNNESNQSFIENDALGGKDPYSASKVGVEAALQAWGQIAMSRGGPSIVSVRAGNVIGGGDYSMNRLIPDLVRGIVAEEIVDIRNPKSTRPWQHVLDPLYGYLLSLEYSLNGDSNKHDTFNFGPTENSLKVEEVTQAFSRIFESRLRTKMTHVRIEDIEARNLDLNSQKAHETLNWSPRWTQQEAIVLTAKWWKNYLEKSNASDLCMNEINEFLRKENHPFECEQKT